MANPLKLMQLMSQFALGKFPKQGKEKLDAIMKVVADHLTDLNIPSGAIERVVSKGRSILKKGSGVPKSVQAFAGGADNAKAIEETLGLARVAWRGVKPAELKVQYGALLSRLESQGVSKKVIGELKKMDPQQFSRLGAEQVLGAYERVGPDPFLIQGYNRIMGKAFTSKKHNAALRAMLPAPDAAQSKAAADAAFKETKKALTEAGLPSFTGSGLVRETARAIGGDSPLGAAVGIGAPAAFTLWGSGGGPNQLTSGEGQLAAAEGFQQLGATSSPEMLTNIARQQEMAARRQMVLQAHDPELFSRVVNALATPDQPGTITTSERVIGRGANQAMPARRPDKDVKFLLDQLMSDMSQF